MSTLQQPSNADLESQTDCNNGRRRSDAVSGGGEQQRADAAIEIVGVGENNNGDKKESERRQSSVSECTVEIVDLEAGAPESKLHLAKIERDCRICHLSMDLTNQDSGFPIELGCSCKEDLALAHTQCAEAWFKIKGNKTCEICGSIAQNVVGVTEAELAESWNETGNAAAAAAAATSSASSQSRNFWQGHRFLNFLLACMVFAFVISWLFHFNVPS